MSGAPTRRASTRPRPTTRLQRVVITATLVATALGAGLATAAPPAGADDTTVACAPRVSRAVFAPWLDPAQYFAAVNGGFEQGTDAWTVQGAAGPVAGNEPFHVGGSDDATSLALGPGASASSRSACLSLLEPTLRMFVRTPAVPGARLTITATVRNPATGLSLTTSWVVVAGLTPPGWAPTPEIVVPNLLGGVLDQDLTVRVAPGGVPATWQIDDVYVDPFKHR